MHKINTIKAYTYLLRIHQEFGSQPSSNLCTRKNTTSYTIHRFHQIEADKSGPIVQDITSLDIKPNKPTRILKMQ